VPPRQRRVVNVYEAVRGRPPGERRCFWTPAAHGGLNQRSPARRCHEPWVRGLALEGQFQSSQRQVPVRSVRPRPALEVLAVHPRRQVPAVKQVLAQPSAQVLALVGESLLLVQAHVGVRPLVSETRRASPRDQDCVPSRGHPRRANLRQEHLASPDNYIRGFPGSKGAQIENFRSRDAKGCRSAVTRIEGRLEAANGLLFKRSRHHYQAQLSWRSRGLTVGGENSP
jgi:hypothetical protein